MSSGNSFNFGPIYQTASGDGSVNQVGNNTATTTVHNGDRVPTVPEVFAAIEEALPPVEAAPDSASADEVKEEVLRPLQAFAEMEPQEQEPRRIEWSNLLERLAPLAPQIARGVAVFSAAALGTLASRNPVVAGVLAVCQANAQPAN